jgi:hypothetical protein
MTLLIADGLPRGLGYVEIDQRASDLPPGTNKHFEADTYTCRHCEAVVILNPARRRERYKCNGCSHHLCDTCGAARAAGATCRTYAQFIDQLRERDARQPQPDIILP